MLANILKEMNIRYEFDRYVPCYYIEPRWRVTTDRGAHIWGTWDCEEKANEGYQVALRLGQPHVSLVQLGIGIAEIQDGQFLIFHADDGLPILSADIGDGETIRRLIAQSSTRSATEFHAWAQQYAEVYCKDTTIKAQ